MQSAKSSAFFLIQDLLVNLICLLVSPYFAETVSRDQLCNGSLIFPLLQVLKGGSELSLLSHAVSDVLVNFLQFLISVLLRLMQVCKSPVELFSAVRNTGLNFAEHEPRPPSRQLLLQCSFRILFSYSISAELEVNFAE